MNANEVVHQLRLQLWDVTYSRYLNSELFSYQWWGILISTLILYVLLWVLVDKKRLMEILLFGAYVSVTDALVVIWGVTTAHWQYNIRLFPLLPAPFPFDFSVLPITLMFVHQHSVEFGRYLLRAALLCAVFAFGLGKIYVAAGIITFYNWPPAYAFLAMVGVAIFSRIAITITKQIIESAGEREAHIFGLAIPQPASKLMHSKEDSAEKEPQP